MKANPQDMLDKLKTGEDKLAMIEEMKDELRDVGYRTRVTRRKLATGQKYYITVTCGPNVKFTSGLHGTRAEVAHVVRHHFPEAHTTSAGTDNVTYAEY